MFSVLKGYIEKMELHLVERANMNVEQYLSEMSISHAKVRAHAQHKSSNMLHASKKGEKGEIFSHAYTFLFLFCLLKRLHC